MEERGEGGAMDKVMPMADSLGELLAAGLRTRDGVHRADWDLTAAGSIPFEKFLEGLNVTGLCKRGDHFFLDENALNIADSIVPLLYCHLLRLLASKIKASTY